VINYSKIHKIKMTPDEVERFQTLLIERSGLVFEGRRVREMEKSISTRMIELGISSFEDYYSFLADPEKGEHELNQLVISLTVGETQFFRTPDQFAALRKYIFPEILERKSEEKDLLLLSAGCSTGEEPYTLAILMRELLSDFDSWNIEIRGCDINQDFLDMAWEGVYTERKLKLVDPATRQKYFNRLSGNRWQVKDFLKEDVTWFHHNITTNDMAGLTGNRKVQLFLCRNVLIYFNQETIQRVIGNFYDWIESQGYLMLGYSESLFKINDSFQPLHTPEAFLYQKAAKPESRQKSIPSHAGPLERNELLQALGSRPHPRASSSRPPQSIERHLKGAGPSRLEKGPAKQAPVVTRTSEQAGPNRAAMKPREESKGPCPSEDALWKQALAFFGEENFTEASDNFRRILEQDPGSARAHLGLGFILANQGHDEEAREYADKAVELDDLMPGTYFLLALLEERGANSEEAIKNYQRVILLDPDFAMAHFNLAHLYLKMERERDAAREFGNTISILERDTDNFSLNFSGGLSREAVISFCRMQLPESKGPAAASGKRSRSGV